MLSAGITPVVHEYGSLGCSGDLAPLAHCALAAMGEGTVRDRSGAAMPASEALAAAGIAPVVLAEKEGLALINGTDGMLGMLVLASDDLRRLLRTADITAAMSVEAQLGTDAVFAADLQALRPHPGQAASAANLRALLAGSPIMASHRGPECTRVQDAYSLRCSPQVHGAARDTLEHAGTVAGSTTPWSPRTGGWRATATSTAPQSATCSTSSRSRSPTSRPCPSAGPTACSTRPAATGCRRSSPTTQASTRGT
jgi:histidine ammonia-lyase